MNHQRPTLLLGAIRALKSDLFVSGAVTLFASAGEVNKVEGLWKGALSYTAGAIALIVCDSGLMQIDSATSLFFYPFPWQLVRQL